MPSYLTDVTLEFSEDDLSDVSPTWIEVTQDLVDIEWWAGISNESDDPQPGGATIRLRNKTRRWEPDYQAGQFYPNITTQRRFRLTLQDRVGSVQEGLWFVTEIAVEYPAGTGYSEVTFTCADGMELLALDDQPLLDPPDAESYADVVSADEPWGYWRLGEKKGTKMVSHTRTVGRVWVGHGEKRHRKKIKKHWKTRETRRAAEGVAGPAGTYRNTPLLGQAGAILGDSDRAVNFRSSETEYVKVIPDDDDFKGTGELTVEAWVKLTNLTGNKPVVTGPINTTHSNPIFWLGNDDASNAYQFLLLNNAGSFVGAEGLTAVAADVWHHVVGTWNGHKVRIYLDGVEDGEYFGNVNDIADSSASPRVDIGRDSDLAEYMAGVIDEVAIYENSLSADRVLAHYTAGAERGWPLQTAGERVADICTNPLWSTAGIQTAGLDVVPAMKHGQATLGEIVELAHTEGPKTMFFFDGDGNPVYLGWEWQATDTAFNESQATFGDEPSEVSYETVEFVYDNETYNDVTVNHDLAYEEEDHMHNVTDDAAIAAQGRRVNTEWTDVLLAYHTAAGALASHVLSFYREPALRPVTVTVNGAKPERLNHILRLDIGHMLEVRKRGEIGTLISRLTHIIGKRKRLDSSRHLTCQWNLARGVNAGGGLWRAGISGLSEAGVTTVAA